MKYLLDTHVWVWSVLGATSLSRTTRGLLNGLSNNERVGLAAISLKEAAWHLAHGRIHVSQGMWQDWLRVASRVPHLEILPLTAEIAIVSESFSRQFPADPADRLIAATAIVHGLTLLTADHALRRSKDVSTRW